MASDLSYLKPGKFFGQVQRQEDYCGLVLSELRHEAARKLPRHSHELAYFCLLLRGAYKEKAGHRLTEYKPFTVGFHPPDSTHQDEIGRAGGHFFSIELSHEWSERLRAWAPVPDSFVDLDGGELSWLATRMFREYRSPGPCSLMAVEGLMLEMLAITTRLSITEKGKPLWLGRVKDFLHSEFRRRLSTGEVADVAGVHPVHLARVFRRFEKTTIAEYVRRLRVQFACARLTALEGTLAEIALEAGFSEQSHFTRAFKSIIGMPPGAFARATKFQALACRSLPPFRTRSAPRVCRSD